MTHLDNLEYYDNFVPDVVVIDYADLMVSTVSKEYRHQLDDIWATLRRIATERDIAVLTATQSNRSGARQDVEESSVAEDLRKLAHVTRMVGLNRNEFDRKHGIIRLRVLADREGDAKEYTDLLVLCCLDLCRFHMDSMLLEDVEYGEGNEKRKTKEAFG